MRTLAVLSAAAVTMVSLPATAETLYVEGYEPAAFNRSPEFGSVFVEPITGLDGERLSFAIAGRLGDVTLREQQWFQVLPAGRSRDAQSILQGHITPSWSEASYRETREICWTTDDRGRCIERREVELDCIRVTMTFAPDLRLVARDGGTLWSDRWTRSQSQGFCPELDPQPTFDAYIAGWIDDTANATRFALAPSFRRRAIRIMESRSGLARNYRDAFRDAVAMTNTDEAAACEMFETLYAANSDQPSLIFNTGLCAEQRGDWELAEARYRQALENDRSDDEGQEGLRRLDTWRSGLAQVEEREAWLAQWNEEGVLTQIDGK